MPVTRRIFMMLPAALPAISAFVSQEPDATEEPVTTPPPQRALAPPPICQGCGAPIIRGTRVAALAATGRLADGNLCLRCLLASASYDSAGEYFPVDDTLDWS
jgi:hypothetical protein